MTQDAQERDEVQRIFASTNRPFRGRLVGVIDPAFFMPATEAARRLPKDSAQVASDDSTDSAESGM